MGAVDTTYTFTATDTITSTKMNNIIDETVMTSDACLSGGGLQVASGQLSIAPNAINNSRLATDSVTSANIVDGTIVNADINASAAIAGTKIAPSFGSQTIRQDGNGTRIQQYNSSSNIVTDFGIGALTGSQDSIGLNVANSIGVLSLGTNSIERMRITASGNVGVNTSSPQNIFEVNAYSAARPSGTSGTSTLEAQSHDYWSSPTYTGTSISQSGSTATGTNCGLPKANLGVLTFQNGSAGLINTNGETPIVFATTATERMRITGGGNVGIGTTTPSSKLQVNGTVTATAFSGPLTGNVTGDVTGSSGSCTGNSATATNLSTNINNWSTNGTISAVVGQLAWKQFGNGHTVFDASAATTPSGAACSQINADIGWQGGLPTLMGWNGGATHGVRVDSARLSESCSGNAATATTASTVSNSAITAAKLNGNQSGSAPIFGVRAWVNFDATRDSNGTTNALNTNRFIRSSGNVTSVKKDVNGKFFVTFTTPFPTGNTNYTVVCSAGDSDEPRLASADRATATVSGIQIETDNLSGNPANFAENNVIVIG